LSDGWSAEVERQCNEHIAGLCAGPAGPGRQRHWQALVGCIAPHVEAWARRSWLLARWRLTGEDDARAVLVLVLERLHTHDHHNLRCYHERRAPEAEASDEGDLVFRLARLAGDEEEPEPEPGTPFRAWLLTLLGHVSRDHVRQRMGFSTAAGPSKREVGTDAARLSDVPEASQRPPITDYLTTRRLLEEIEAFTATFPADMRTALLRWQDDETFDDIARELALPDAAGARKLVRAAQARLRERFRDRWSGFQ
jgi:DNA-directed RNA polymerase specialized sigma24 family protein